jgi:aspartate kinase
MAGTTNILVEIAQNFHDKKISDATHLLGLLKVKYLQEIEDLFSTALQKEQALELLDAHFNFISAFGTDLFTTHEERAILAQGEYLSTALFHLYMTSQNHKVALLDACQFVRLNLDGEPDMDYLKTHIQEQISAQPEAVYYITQGFICRNAFGEIDNLKRGGSDYSASLIGAAVAADEIQIWTDIDGMHNNDPRIVENTRPIAHLSFDEAAELAYFGAKILHPSSVLPAQNANIPVRLKNTMQPEASGTLISNKTEKSQNIITAVAAKDGITAIKIKSGRMLMAYGFLRKVFEIFEAYKTPIDMITTSEVAVSLTIDNQENLASIVSSLESFGTVEVDSEQCIICVVGNFIAENRGCAKLIFDALESIPLRMISYGGSRHNISVLVHKNYKNEALQNIFTQLQNHPS